MVISLGSNDNISSLSGQPGVNVLIGDGLWQILPPKASRV